MYLTTLAASQGKTKNKGKGPVRQTINSVDGLFMGVLARLESRRRSHATGCIGGLVTTGGSGLGMVEDHGTGGGGHAVGSPRPRCADAC